MVGWYKMPGEDTTETYLARGKQHLVILDTDECGDLLRTSQPELDWENTTWPVLPYQELLVFVCAGAVASAEATDIEWAQAAPTLKNVTEIWASIIMHMTDWSRCTIGTLCQRINKATLLMSARPVLFYAVEAPDLLIYDVTMDFENKKHEDELKRLTKACEDGGTSTVQKDEPDRVRPVHLARRHTLRLPGLAPAH